MSKRWYAVQLGDDLDCGYGSTVKREAMKMANRLAKQYPDEKISICLCREGSDFCEGEIIVRNGKNAD